MRKGQEEDSHMNRKLTQEEVLERAMQGNPATRALAHTALMQETQTRTQQALQAAAAARERAAASSSQRTRICRGEVHVDVRSVPGAAPQAAGTSVSAATALAEVQAAAVAQAQSKLARARSLGDAGATLDTDTALRLVDEGLALLPSNVAEAHPVRAELYAARLSLLQGQGETRQCIETLQTAHAQCHVPWWEAAHEGDAAASDAGACAAAALLNGLHCQVGLLEDVVSDRASQVAESLQEWWAKVHAAGYGVKGAPGQWTAEPAEGDCPAPPPLKLQTSDFSVASLMAQLEEEEAQEAEAHEQAPEAEPQAGPVPAQTASAQAAKAPQPAQPEPVPESTKANFSAVLQRESAALAEEERKQPKAPKPARRQKTQPVPANPPPAQPDAWGTAPAPEKPADVPQATLRALFDSRAPLRADGDAGAMLDTAVTSLNAHGPAGAQPATALLNAAFVQGSLACQEALKCRSSVFGQTLLGAAARAGAVSIVQRLLGTPSVREALLNAADDFLITPAAAAVDARHSALAALLVQGARARSDFVVDCPRLQDPVRDTAPTSAQRRLPAAVLAPFVTWFNTLLKGQQAVLALPMDPAHQRRMPGLPAPLRATAPQQAASPAVAPRPPASPVAVEQKHSKSAVAALHLLQGRMAAVKAVPSALPGQRRGAGRGVAKQQPSSRKGRTATRIDPSALAAAPKAQHNQAQPAGNSYAAMARKAAQGQK